MYMAILKDSKVKINFWKLLRQHEIVFGVDYRNIKKLTGKQKDRSIGDKILSEGRFSLISDQDLIKLEKFVNSKLFITNFF